MTLLQCSCLVMAHSCTRWPDWQVILIKSWKVKFFVRLSGVVLRAQSFSWSIKELADLKPKLLTDSFVMQTFFTKAISFLIFLLVINSDHNYFYWSLCDFWLKVGLKLAELLISTRLRWSFFKQLSFFFKFHKNG